MKNKKAIYEFEIDNNFNEKIPIIKIFEEDSILVDKSIKNKIKIQTKNILNGGIFLKNVNEDFIIIGENILSGDTIIVKKSNCLKKNDIGLLFFENRIFIKNFSSKYKKVVKNDPVILGKVLGVISLRGFNDIT